MTVPRPPLVGRQPELDALLRQWTQAASGTIRVVLVDGEPGIGKSRLLDAVGAHATAEESIVLRGGASDAAGMPPYLPFLEALGEYVLAADADCLREQAGPFATVLATILPELAACLGELPSSYVLPPEQARFRLYEGVDRFLAEIAAEKPLLLLLDDLQWADPATLDLLCHIARRHRPGSPLLIVGAYRTDELPLNTALQRTLTELNRLRVASTVTLNRLSAADVASMAAIQLDGPLAPAAVQPLFTQSEGNPFFVEELVLVWLAQGVVVRRADATGRPLFDLAPSVALPLPPGIVSAVRQRLGHIGADVVELLRIAAVIGRTFDVGLLAVAAGLDPESCEDRLRTGVSAQLIRPVETGAYTFSHDKIRECLYQELTRSRLSRLHGAIGEALEADAARTDARQLAELAFHFARAGDSVRGATHSVSAAEHAMRSYAPAEAAIHFQAALNLLTADDSRRGALLSGLGDALLLTGAEDDALAVYHAARAWFERRGDSIGAGRAAHATGRAWWRREAIDEAHAALEDAVARLDQAPGPDLVAALVDLGSLLASSLHRHDDGIAHTRRALALARRLPDDGLVVSGTRSLGNLLVRSNDLSRGIALLEEALVLATTLGNPFEAAECCAGLATAYLWQGNARRSREIALRRLAFAERCHDIYQLRHVYSWLAFVDTFLGDWEAVDAHLEQAQSITDALASPEPRAFLHFVRGAVALNRGEPDVAERDFEAAMAIFRAIGPDALIWYLPSLGLAQALLGDTEGARACIAECESLLARVPADTMAVADPLAYFVSIDLVVGDRDRLRQYLTRLAPFRGQFHDMLTDRLLGETALALGDHAMARRHLQLAETIARQESLPLELARVLEATSAVYQAGAAQAGARSRSELLAEAAHLYQRSGNVPAAARLRDQIAALARPAGRPAGLTGREAQVLRLLASGLSNRQIADELALSEKTVENHLTSAYGKIGADNRAAASAFAVRHGLA